MKNNRVARMARARRRPKAEGRTRGSGSGGGTHPNAEGIMKLTGLIGYPLSHSLSPRIHEYWIKHYNLNADYKLFTTPPARVRQVVKRLRDKGATGFNVTIPHKLAVMEFLDSIDPLATRIGAVNTVTSGDGKLTGTNTDAYGFISNLREGLTGNVDGDLAPWFANVVVLGAGGATRAAVVALKDAGAKEITIINRSADKATELAQEFSLKMLHWTEKNAALAAATLLVNTTSLGMVEQPPLELDLACLNHEAAVHDIVYAPLETELLKKARAASHKTVDGLGMLLYQAQKAFEMWHGVLPTVTAELRAHVLELPR